MNLRIERKNKAADTDERYDFYLFSDYNSKLDLVLDRYVKYPVRGVRCLISRYDRLSDRDSTIKEADVVIPEDVAEEAKQKLIDSIRVIKWTEHRY